MSDPNNPVNGVNLSGAPGGSINLDELFPNPDAGLNLTSVETSTGEQPPPAPPAASQPPPTQPTGPYLRTPTGTVYNTQEDAIQGIAHKDALLEQLRQRYINEKGVDPITNKPVERPQAAPPRADTYLTNPKKLYDEMADAVNRGDAQAWTEKLGQFVGEYVGKVLEPAAPLVLESAKERAVQTLRAAGLTEVDTFLDSPDYKSTLDSLPKLKEAIGIAESNLEAAHQLPEFYRLAYYATQGRRLPELLKANNGQPSQPTRPTVQPSTMAPPSSPAVQPDMGTPEGRKAIIERGRTLGLDKVQF